MKKFKKIDKSWTLFLDRDGVINKKLEGDYVKRWEEFEFIDGSISAIFQLAKIFGKVFIVTNQRGVGKGVMSRYQLEIIHKKMLNELSKNYVFIENIYYCTCISDRAYCRKPNIGMAMRAKAEYPDLDFKKAFMVGDSISDMVFGENLGMQKILIQDCSHFPVGFRHFNNLMVFKSLKEFSLSLEHSQSSMDT